MLEAVKPDTTQSDPELIKTVYAKIKDMGINQVEASKKIGISKAALSMWLTNKYTGDIGSVEHKVQLWLNNAKVAKAIKHNLPNAPAYFETPTSKRIMAALAYAQMASDLAIVHGGAGNSKTLTLNKYAQENPNVWVVDVTPCSSTPAGLLRVICQTLKERCTTGTTFQMEQRIRERLRDTNGLLIIDEAQFLGERAIECVRRFADMSEVGVVLCGNDIVYAQLTGNSRRSAEFAQLFSRVGKRVRITKPSAADVNALCQAWGITTDKERRMVATIANKPGALRMCTKVLRFASLIANGKSETLNVNHIKTAWNDLGGEL